MQEVTASIIQGLAVKLARLFEAAQIDYAVGGALCLGVWAPPRGTIDVDITAFVEEKDYERLVDLLEGAGCGFDREDSLKQLREQGVCQITLNNYRVDLYVPDVHLYSTAHRRRRRALMGGDEIWVWSPEDLIMFKLMYFREKDKVDVMNILAVQGKALDFNSLRSELLDAVGEGDERIAWWDSAVKQASTEIEI